jgi:aldehyde dehydrogenase (NAD+)
MTNVADILESMAYGPAPEGAEPATEWLERHGGRFGHFIGGAWRGADATDRFETINPATAAPLASVAQGTADDVDAAVRAAREAYAGWSALDGHARARYLYALARHIQKHARLFAVLETLDNGKPIRESRDIDIPLVARHFYHHAGWAELMESRLGDYGPVGVIGQIVPWNFPLLMLAWKVAPALAMGNTVVLKPAEFTPLTSLLFGEICEAVGLPPGVVNVVTGDGRTGALLVDHDDVDKIAFTGSTEVGRLIREATAGTGKRLSLELGGKSPFVVYEDADLDSVVEGVVDAIWFNQGQVCCAGSRILVQEGVSQQLIDKLKARMETLRIGDPLDKAVDMGAIVAPVQLEKIQQLVRQGADEGAAIWQPSWSTPREGYFYPPTLCTDVTPSSTISQVEIFGPVVVLMTFRTPAEAIALANNTRYGLAASVWSENINTALDTARRVKAGTVWINCTNVFDAASGFGGYRESGFGREGGLEGLWEYVRLRDEPPAGDAPGGTAPVAVDADAIDRTPKLYIGGAQARPDGGYSLAVAAPDGTRVGEVGRGNRKDLRNAVEAARKAEGWSGTTSHLRAQILYYIAENLQARHAEFAERLQVQVGAPADAADAEVHRAVRRLFTYAAWADKWDGHVHHTPFRNVTLAMPEPIGVMGLVCPDVPPLLGAVSLLAPAVAAGNTVVLVPSERHPLSVTDLYQVLDTSDVPAGVINIVTGLRAELTETLAAHDGVDALWYFGGDEGGGSVERLSTGNMKRTWVDGGRTRAWDHGPHAEGEEFLREATQIKNIWVPYGD